MVNKGIILSGGLGTRMYPLTLAINKQLMPVYDKPMIYYPLSVLMLAGIKDILIIAAEHDQALFQKQLRDGSQWGIKISYAIEPQPRGLAQAFIIGEEFIQGNSCAMVLGDNIFHGPAFGKLLRKAAQQASGATVFAYQVKDPEKFGVVTFHNDGRVRSLEEKPARPESNWAVTGLYFYDQDVVDMAKTLTPSARGELEITDLNRLYMEKELLKVELLGRGYAWLDTGSHESLLQASNYIQTIEERQGLKISCPEEIAYRRGYIGVEQLRASAVSMSQNSYGQYLFKLIDREHN